MEYTTSKIEIKRRKLAYLALSVSLIFGTFLSALIYQFPIPLIIYLLEILALFLIGVLSFYFFKKIASLKIALTANSLQRKTNDFLEEYRLTEIKKVKIKWTTRNSIREIYLWTKGGKSISLTGLNDFEKFRKDLLNKLSKQVIVHEWKEPLDFDSLLFYPALGLIMSNLSVLTYKSLINLNYQQIKFSTNIFAIYLLTLGAYFLLTKPISKASGNKTKIQDYLVGLVMIISGLFILVNQKTF